METRNPVHAAIIEDLRQSGLSIEAIATKHGRDPATIHKLRRKHDVMRLQAHKRPRLKPFSRTKSLSSEHHAPGIRLTCYRGARTVTVLAREVCVSRHTIKKMELGCHDFMLTQLTRISGLLGAPFKDILAPLRFTGKDPVTGNADKLP